MKWKFFHKYSWGLFFFPQKTIQVISDHISNKKTFSWFWKNPTRSLYSVKSTFLWSSVCLPAPPHSLVLLSTENKYLERKKREHFSPILDTRRSNITVLKPLQGKQNLRKRQLASRLETNRTPRITCHKYVSA